MKALWPCVYLCKRETEQVCTMKLLFVLGLCIRKSPKPRTGLLHRDKPTFTWLFVSVYLACVNIAHHRRFSWTQGRSRPRQWGIEGNGERERKSEPDVSTSALSNQTKHVPKTNECTSNWIKISSNPALCTYECFSLALFSCKHLLEIRDMTEGKNHRRSSFLCISSATETDSHLNKRTYWCCPHVYMKCCWLQDPKNYTRVKLCLCATGSRYESNSSSVFKLKSFMLYRKTFGHFSKGFLVFRPWWVFFMGLFG